MSVDLRTRSDTDQAPVGVGSFFRETLPGMLDANRRVLAPGASELSLDTFCIETDGEPWTLSWVGERVSVAPGHEGQSRVRLTTEQLSDIVNDQSTPIALMSNAILEMV